MAAPRGGGGVLPFPNCSTQTLPVRSSTSNYQFTYYYYFVLVRLLVRYKCLFQQWQCLTGPISGCAPMPADSASLLWGCGGIPRLARPSRLHVARGFCLRLPALFYPALYSTRYTRISQSLYFVLIVDTQTYRCNARLKPNPSPREAFE